MKEPLTFKPGDQVTWRGKRYQIKRIHEFGAYAGPQAELQGLGPDFEFVVGAELKECEPIIKSRKKT